MNTLTRIGCRLSTVLSLPRILLHNLCFQSLTNLGLRYCRGVVYFRACRSCAKGKRPFSLATGPKMFRPHIQVKVGPLVQCDDQKAASALNAIPRDTFWNDPAVGDELCDPMVEFLTVARGAMKIRFFQDSRNLGFDVSLISRIKWCGYRWRIGNRT